MQYGEVVNPPAFPYPPHPVIIIPHRHTHVRFQARLFIAALAPADARSCLPLATRPATRGRLLLATVTPDAVALVPPLVRFAPEAAVGPVAPDTRLDPAAPIAAGKGL